MLGERASRNAGRSTSSAAFDAWVERARSVSIECEIERRGIRLNGSKIERCGPCPVCGGDDRFSINVKKGVFNCRGCGVGGDIIKLVEHLDGVDFVGACTTLVGESSPKTNGKDDTAAQPKKIVAARSDYTDQAGNILFQVERAEYQKADGSFVLTKDGKRKKTFRQRRPDPNRPGDWLWNVDGVPVVPYRLPELIEAVASGHTILVVEGEAKADLLWSWNIPATCCACGAGKWRATHAEFLRGAEVVILPDNDAAGRNHADVVAASLQEVAASVRVLELPGLPPKGDVIDWAKAGSTVEQLHELIGREAKPWTPGKAEPRRRSGNLEDEVALAFAAEHAGDLRYVALWNRWMQWDGDRWGHEDTLRAFDLARALCRTAADAKAKTVAAVVTLARTDRAIAGREDQWDLAGELFNVPTKEIAVRKA
jgi:putative DNA primase/helicase